MSKEKNVTQEARFKVASSLKYFIYHMSSTNNALL